jgi:ABC-type phosphate/phosphonate transport system substrate-binding protein
MYNATPEAASAWRTLFGRVFSDLVLSIDVIEHRWPRPIEALWAEPELCCAFMCGWPFAQDGRMQAIAAPVPSPAHYEGAARYRSEFLVRASSGFARLEDAFGHRFGWMARNSHSGFNAPRAHLARFASATRPTLFSESIGPLGNPAKALEALEAGTVDVIALDGFYLDLVRHHDPAKLSAVRTIAVTDWSPIPLLVAAPSIERAMVERLQARLVGLHEDASIASLMHAALVQRFVVPNAVDYARLERLAGDAAASGYSDIR